MRINWSDINYRADDDIYTKEKLGDRGNKKTDERRKGVRYVIINKIRADTPSGVNTHECVNKQQGFELNSNVFSRRNFLMEDNA